MADVTIGGLTPGTPSTSAVIPYSQGGTTNSTTVANIGAALGLGGSGSFNLPSGTTAQRPVSPVAGAIRFNTTLKTIEFYTGTAWSSDSYLVDVLLIGGGGGAGAYGGGGGGGGGFLEVSISLFPGTNYPIVVGTGGGGGQNGQNTVGFDFNAIGGGFGQTYGTQLGGSGGSGGGGASLSSGTSTGAGGSGTPSQGFNGGVGYHRYGSGAAGGGGGGAGSVGGNYVNESGPGGGGAGKAWKGLAQVYSQGGNGTSTNFGNNGVGASGAANTGNGGSAGNNGGGSGGSGIAIVRYLGSVRGTGGTITNPGDGYTYHTFTQTGSNSYIG